MIDDAFACREPAVKYSGTVVHGGLEAASRMGRTAVAGEAVGADEKAVDAALA